MKLAVAALWAGMAFLLWQQRERARPLMDLYEAWRDAGYQEPPPLPRLEGTIVKALPGGALQIKDAKGQTYNLTLAGADGMDAGLSRDPMRLRRAAELRTNLTARLAGQPVEFAYTLLQPNRTGVGFAYLGTNQVNLTMDLVASGQAKIIDKAVHVLPLREQMALRAAERKAQTERLGLWNTTDGKIL